MNDHTLGPRTHKAQGASRTDDPSHMPKRSAPRPRRSPENSDDPIAHVRSLNQEHTAHEELYIRTRQASDSADRAHRGALVARANAQDAHKAYLTSQAEEPDRRAPLLQQAAIASGTLSFDAVACYFAAEALGSDELQTCLWAALFLATLATAEIALDRYAERSRKIWRTIAAGLLLFVSGLAILRFVYFDVVSAGGPIAALVGAFLFSVFTIGFVAAGYRALRAAETIQTWKAHRRARQADKEAGAKTARAAQLVASRDRLADAYLAILRPRLLRSCTRAQLQGVEEAVRRHLIGEQP